MPDVCLVQMPFADLQRPALGLSILKSSLRATSLTCEVTYANLDFAAEVGFEVFNELCNGTYQLAGEWAFAGAAFPNFAPDHDLYIRRYIEARDGLTGQPPEPSAHQATLLWRAREHATAFVETLAARILDRHPHIVGCTSMFQQHTAALALLRRIKEADPHVVTLIGGPNCDGAMGLAIPKYFPWVDFAMIGEADTLFPSICETLVEHGADVDMTRLPRELVGAPSRHSGADYEERGRSEAPRGTVRTMDEIPIPDFDDYFASLRRSTLAAAILPALPIETSRGCWWGMKHHCTFCGLNGKGMVFRSKSPDRVLDELEYLSRRHDIHRFQVVDNILDDKYFNSVIPRLAKSRPRYSLFMECKSNVSRHDVRSLSNAGVRWVQPGIESLHDNLLALMKKGTTAHINTQLLKWSREYGIRLYWLVLFGFPGERDDWYAQMAEWLPLIVHLEPPIGMTAISFDRFSPYHTTPEAFGLSNLQPVDWYSYVYPLAPDALTEVACYFDDHEARRARSDTDSLTDEHTRPGLAALRRVLAEWRQLWDPFNTRLLSNGGRVTRGEGRPILSMRERDRGIVIVDTRPVADERETLLEGRAADVYRACDVARTDQGLTKALAEQFQWKPTWSEIQRILTELVSRRLVVELSGHFLSLAVREPSRPYPAIYPGGGVTGRW